MKRLFGLRGLLLLCFVLTVAQESWAGVRDGNTVTYNVNGHGNENPWLSDAVIITKDKLPFQALSMVEIGLIEVTNLIFALLSIPRRCRL